MIKIKYLGTGAAEGFPGVFCECEACKKARIRGGNNIKMRSCTLLNEHILIDISPDIYAQSLRWNVRMSQIDNVIMTHSHEDHLDTFSVYTRLKHGATILPDVPAEKDCVHFYGNKEVESTIESAMRQMPHADLNRLCYHYIKPGEKISVGELEVIPLLANHKKDENCYIYAMTDGEKNFLYANDSGELPNETLNLIKNLNIRFDMVSMDCARGTLPGDGHMGIKENRQLKQALMEVGVATENTKFYLNHLSHMSGIIHDELQAMVNEDGMTVTYDGLELII